MKKNVASQKVGVQMVSATDGSAFTGSVTAYVTGDAGTQAAGSVGSGACTHEGNGYHTYAPAQAETNYDLVAFTFIGTGAVPATVQVYTTFPQTGDSFGLIGSTGSGLTSLATQASVNTIDDFLDTEIAAILAAVDTEVAAILADTNELQTDWANGGRLDNILDARSSQTSVDDLPTNAELATALGTADDAVLAQVALVKAKTDNLPSDPADASVVAGLIAAVETKVDTVDTVVDAIKAKTDSLTFTQAGNVDANIQYVNDVQVTGDGETGTEWGPA